MDLQTFIRDLETHYPSEVLRVTKGPLSPAEGECTALLHHLMRMGKWPAAVFEHVTTLKGERWPGTAVYGVAGTWTKVGIGYGLPPDDLNPLAVQFETAKRIGQLIKSVVVDPTDAPVKKQTFKSKEISFFDLPGYRNNLKDSRPGWVTGVIIGKDPDTGRYNLSWHRNNLLRPDRATCRIEPRHFWEIMQKYERAGKEWVPFAQVFGHHVGFGLAGAIRTGQDVDEYELAGGIFGEPLRLTPSTALGDDFLIPADAEVVLEGYVSTKERDFNGPWVDFLRYYSPQTKEPVIKIAALDMRSNPHFEHTWVGQYVYSDVAHSSFLRNFLATRFKGVGAVNYVAPCTVIIQFHPNRPGDVRRLVGMAHAYGDFVKHIIVVDDDIDPFDLSQVFFAMGTRVDASKQTYVVDGLSPLRQDPSAKGETIFGTHIMGPIGGLVVDSTKPVAQVFDEIGYPEKTVLEKIKLKSFVDDETVGKLVTGRTTRPWAMI